MATGITKKLGMAVCLTLAVGSAVSACGGSPTSAGTSTATGSNVGIPADSGSVPGASGMTVGSLEAAVKGQIVTGRPSGLGFGNLGIATVVCHPPTEWVPSARWTCVAYSRKGGQLGTYTGTTESDGTENGVNTPEWSGEFRPRA